MEIMIQLTDDGGGKNIVKIDKVKFQKMIFLFNTLEEGWTIKKKSDSYYLLKNHEGKRKIFLDSFLPTFIAEALDINKILS